MRQNVSYDDKISESFTEQKTLFSYYLGTGIQSNEKAAERGFVIEYPILQQVNAKEENNSPEAKIVKIMTKVNN